jgi:hypothetical protein
MGNLNRILRLIVLGIILYTWYTYSQMAGPVYRGNHPEFQRPVP